MTKKLFIYISTLLGSVVLSMYNSFLDAKDALGIGLILLGLVISGLWLIYRNYQFNRKINKLQQELINLQKAKERQLVVAENGFADIYYYLLYQDEHLGITSKLLEHRISSLYHASLTNNIQLCNLIVQITLTILEKSASFEVLSTTKNNLLSRINSIQNANRITQFDKLKKQLSELKEIEFFMTK